MAVEFDFISDERFRKSLDCDYREMCSSLEAGAWKAVHVLAGSIVEAILIEYLSVSRTAGAGSDPLRMDLNDAIEACKAAGVMQGSTASLCDVIRNYRNLIHPGRVIRLKQEVSADGAQIASSLVSMITREVASKRKEVYGATAEQIVKKVKSDQYSIAVLPHLLSEANEHELARLVTALIPHAYFDESSFMPDDSVLARLSIAYRLALSVLREEDQTKVAEAFAKMVREESDENIQRFSDPFFRANQLALLKKRDANLIVTHLITRLENVGAISDNFMATLEHIANFVSEDEIAKLADLLVRQALKQPQDMAARFIAFAGAIFDNADEPRQEILVKRLDEVLKRANERVTSETVKKRLTDLETAWLQIPF